MALLNNEITSSKMTKSNKKKNGKHMKAKGVGKGSGVFQSALSSIDGGGQIQALEDQHTQKTVKKKD